MIQLKNKDKYSLIATLFIIASISFALPSIIYLIKHKTVLKFEPYFHFLYDLPISRIVQTIIYIFILAILTILYFMIIKNRQKLFSNTRKMFIYISIISVIFIAVLPFTCSDVFYYLGIGRLNSQYGQNPYYTTIKKFVENENNNKFLQTDTVLKQGYMNDWANSSSVYGPIWTLICSIVSRLSFGNIDVGLMLFKIVNAIVHILSCYLIYKISHKKIFTLIYGLNPFILIEGIGCVHNDSFVNLFILLALYYVVKRKNLIVSTAFLAMATAIKYFAIILLPFIIIYYYRKEKPLMRFKKCILYGLLFLAILFIPYLFYMRDLNILNGIFVQQQKLAKSFYIIILQYFKEPKISAIVVNRILIVTFILIYTFVCIQLLRKKKITLKKEMKIANYFIMAFLFLLITNFQPWYIMWIFPLIMWQNAENILWIPQIAIISQFVNSIFLIYGEGWQNGIPFTFIFIVSSLIILIANQKLKKITH